MMKMKKRKKRVRLLRLHLISFDRHDTIAISAGWFYAF